MKNAKRLFEEGFYLKMYALILFSGLLLFAQIILQTIPTLAVSNPITPTPQLVSGPNCQGQVTLRWDINPILNQTNANRVFWELKKDQTFQNLEGREPVRLDGKGSTSVPTGQVTINLGNYGQLVNGTVYYFRIVAKRFFNDVARRSDPVQFTYNCVTPTPTATPQTGATGRKLNVWVYEDGTFNNATKQGQWIQGATVRVVKNPTSQSTPPYNQTRTTGVDGKAVFDNVAPNGAYDVTVQKVGCDPGLQGVTTTVGIPNNVDAKQYRDLDCAAESPTPPPAAGSEIPGRPLISITKFELSGGAEEVVVNTDVSLDYEYTGLTPTHYKAVECSAFNAPYIKWVPLPGSGKPTIKIPTPRNSTTCLQLKRQLSHGLEAKSNIAKDSILVTPRVAQQPGTGVSPVHPVTGTTAASSCPQSIAAPSPSSPLEGASCVGTGAAPPSNQTVTFQWLAVDGVGGQFPYVIQYHKVGTSTCAEDGSTNLWPNCGVYRSNTTSYSENLSHSSNYRWRVKGVCVDVNGDKVNGQWSNWNTFATRPEASELQLTSPSNGESVAGPQNAVGYQVELRWAEPPCGAFGYTVRLFKSDGQQVTSATTGSPSVTVGVTKGETYTWNVTASTQLGNMSSNTWSFTAQ